MSKYIIGFGGYDFDTSAVLLKDGKLEFAIQEERLNRQKHCGNFPYLSIDLILNKYNLNSQEVSFAFPFNADQKSLLNEAFSNVFKNPYNVLKNFNLFKKHYQFRKGNFKRFESDLNSIFKHKINPKKISFYNHHKSHFASSHFTSGFQNSAGLCFDLEGDMESTTGWLFKDNKIKKIFSIKYPHSLGVFYNRWTRFLGFNTHDEYKVMGLSAYGKPKYLNEMKKILKKTKEGYMLNLKFFDPLRGYLFNDKVIELFGKPYSKNSKNDQKMADIACSMQNVFEDVVIHLINILKKKTDINNLVLSGGCALNSKANGLILEKNIFKNTFIHSSASDSGVALGAAYLDYYKNNKNCKSIKVSHDYYGPEFSNEEVEKQLINSKVKFEKISNPSKVGADLIKQGQIIGWFQGKMEFGQRALGNRSIFSNSYSKEMKDKINSAIKFREPFRPFAPICKLDDMKKYFVSEKPSPFMNFTVKVKKEFKQKIPAIVHEDGTARLQTITSESNKLVFNLLSELEKLSCIPVIINTSFNVAGEPIVCKPHDAIRTFYTSGLDALIINNFLIIKK